MCFLHVIELIKIVQAYECPVLQGMPGVLDWCMDILKSFSVENKLVYTAGWCRIRDSARLMIALVTTRQNNDDVGCLKDRKRTNQTSGHRHLKSSKVYVYFTLFCHLPWSQFTATPTFVFESRDLDVAIKHDGILRQTKHLWPIFFGDKGPLMA